MYIKNREIELGFHVAHADFQASQLVFNKVLERVNTKEFLPFVYFTFLHKSNYMVTFKQLKNLGWKTCSILYSSYDTSILTYASGVWGFAD